MSTSDIVGLVLFGGFGLWLILAPNMVCRFYYLFYRQRMTMPKPSAILFVGIGWLIFVAAVAFFGRHLPLYR
jgi:hypothetical protein